MRKSRFYELQSENDELRELNKRLQNRLSHILESDSILRAKFEEVVSENGDKTERLKTLETVNKRHQEEIKKVREENSQLESMLDDAIEILLAFLFNR